MALASHRETLLNVWQKLFGTGLIIGLGEHGSFNRFARLDNSGDGEVLLFFTPD